MIYLEWDSNLIGKKVGKISVTTADEFNSKFFPDALELVYVFSDSKFDTEQIKIQSGELIFADEKRIFSKSELTTNPLDSNIHSFSSFGEISEEFYKLALQSGSYSRFTIDPLMPGFVFDSMYRQWLQKSVSKVIADEVMVYLDKDHIAGFITLAKKDGYSEIGLIAVDSVYRSRGIGKTLLQAAENWTKNIADLDQVKVATQGANSGACRFYQQNGFSLDSITYVYHWWSKQIK